MVELRQDYILSGITKRIGDPVLYKEPLGEMTKSYGNDSFTLRSDKTGILKAKRKNFLDIKIKRLADKDYPIPFRMPFKGTITWFKNGVDWRIRYNKLKPVEGGEVFSGRVCILNLKDNKSVYFDFDDIVIVDNSISEGDSYRTGELLFNYLPLSVYEKLQSAKRKKTNLSTVKDIDSQIKIKTKRLEELDSKLKFQAEETISIAEKEAAQIIKKADKTARSIKLSVEQEQADIQKLKERIDEESESLSVDAHLTWFAIRIGDLKDIALDNREKLRRLHTAIGEALEKSQGAKPGLSNDIDEAMHKGDKIDLLYRFYGQKIAEYKTDETLDPDIKQAAILGLQEQMERQIQEISGAFEPE